MLQGQHVEQLTCVARIGQDSASAASVAYKQPGIYLLDVDHKSETKSALPLIYNLIGVDFMAEPFAHISEQLGAWSEPAPPGRPEPQMAPAG